MGPRLFEQVAAVEHRMNGMESRLTLAMQRFGDDARDNVGWVPVGNR